MRCRRASLDLGADLPCTVCFVFLRGNGWRLVVAPPSVLYAGGPMLTGSSG